MTFGVEGPSLVMLFASAISQKHAEQERAQAQIIQLREVLAEQR